MTIWQTKTVARILQAGLMGDPQAEVRGCVLDSRLAQGGEIFMAFAGQKVNGFNYIASAWERGAVLAVAEVGKEGIPPNIPEIPAGKALILVDSAKEALQKLAAFRRQELGAKVVGVTGSNGKTTTKDMIAAVLGQKFKVYKNIENQNNELGLPLTILNAPADTEILVLEMGMRGLREIAALCRIASPDLGVITNIGFSHLELLGTQDKIAQAKWELIESLPAGGVAVLNAEDLYSCQMAQDTQATVLYYGLEGQYHQPDIQGRDLSPRGLLGTSFTVSFADQAAIAELPLPGRHNVLDALAALAVGITWGIPLPVGVRGLAEMEISKMRLETMTGIRNSILLNDVYNANPVSMMASLGILQERAAGSPTMAILGEMYELGLDSQTGHRAVGEKVAELGIDRLITVGKMAEDIATGARISGFPENCLHICATREEAVSCALDVLAELPAGAWVLIKGSRGMKMEEITARLRLQEKEGEK
jgi:UDP-N-acetylmuramoyl-tripeptide--D-alanyl-D-alanine ligase